MEPRLIDRGEMTIVGMIFYGDPFHATGVAPEQNEVGRLWARFSAYKVSARGNLYDVCENISVRNGPLDRRLPVVASFLRPWAEATLFVLAGLPFVLLRGVQFFLAVSARS